MIKINESESNSNATQVTPLEKNAESRKSKQMKELVASTTSSPVFIPNPDVRTKRSLPESESSPVRLRSELGLGQGKA